MRVSRSIVVKMGRWSALGGLLPGSKLHWITESKMGRETNMLSGQVQFFVLACSSVGY
jgi:hypothetical protein